MGKEEVEGAKMNLTLSGAGLVEAAMKNYERVVLHLFHLHFPVVSVISDSRCSSFCRWE